MIDEEILGGLRAAISRGESLEKAMMSFYNSGYKKEKIEEAARSLQMHERQPVQIQPKKTINQGIQKPRKLTRKEKREKKKLEKSKNKSIIKKSQIPQSNIKKKPSRPQPTKQSVSNYESQNPREKLLIIVLVTLLFFLLAILGTIFFFKDELITLFNNLFQNGFSLYAG